MSYLLFPIDISLIEIRKCLVLGMEMFLVI